MEITNCNKGRIGDICELKACAWLLDEGYEVFRNVSSKGPIDIIALNEKETILVDVKKVTDGNRRYTNISQPRISEQQIKLNVKLLYYCEKTDTFRWTLDEIKQNLGKPLKREEHQIVNLMGYQGPLGTICKQLKVPRSTVQGIANRYPNKTLSECFELALQNKKRIEYNNKFYKDKQQLYTDLNISRYRVEYLEFNKGMSFTDAVSQVMRKTHGSNDSN